MNECEADLGVLCIYLGIEEHPNIEYTKHAEGNHLTNPRFFAYTEEVDGKIQNQINVCRAIDNLPPDVRIGVLLHELGHIHAGLDEVDADNWVLSVCPESDYQYEERLLIESPDGKDPVEIKSIQRVSNSFMQAIGHMECD